MPNVWMVRADGGAYANHFAEGGYAGIGWNLGPPSVIAEKAALAEAYRRVYREDSNAMVGVNVGQIGRFLHKIEVGDYILTPTANAQLLLHGRVTEAHPYYDETGDDGCPYAYRRKVDWAESKLRRSEFSESFKNTIGGLLTVFQVRQSGEFLRIIGDASAPHPPPPSADPFHLVLDRLLELHPKEFEYLIGDLMTAMGFPDPTVTPYTSDHGIDVKGELDLHGLAAVKLVVQVKRYKRSNAVSAQEIRHFRADVPMGYQGAFVTTSRFQPKAKSEAIREGYLPIGLIDGNRLVELLNDHWEGLVKRWASNADPESASDISIGLEQKLGLRRGLVLA